MVVCLSILLRHLYHVMAYFDWNLHFEIASGNSVLSTTFSEDYAVDTTYCSMTHYDITIGNDVARDVHCEIIMIYDIVMGTYRDILHCILMFLRPSFIMYYDTQL